MNKIVNKIEIPTGNYDLQYVKSNGKFALNLANLTEKEVVENIASFRAGKHFGCVQIRTLNRATGLVAKF